MKQLKTLFVVAGCFVALVSAKAAPRVSVDEALKIANSYLKENGRTDVWISAIVLEKPAAAGSEIWSVKWNLPVALDDTKRETGIEVAMDRSVARYTEKVANANTPAVAGIPADRAPLSNHRTRTTRPSILDLKH